MSLCKCNSLLSDYAKEIGVGELSLEELIVSHRRLRSYNLENYELQRKLIDEAVKRAEKEIRDANWVRWGDLKKMSMFDIANKIAEFVD